MATQLFTDEMAAAIWGGGDTASLAGLEVKDPPVEAAANDDDKKIDPITDDKLVNIWGPKTEEDDDEPPAKTDPPAKTTAAAQPATATHATAAAAANKGGRKPELVSFVNKLVEEESLLGFDGQEINTVEDAKELILQNLKQKEKDAYESGYEERKKAFSPQVQAVLHYAENGAQSAEELLDLLGAIKGVEDIEDFKTDTPAGSENVIRQALKAKGLKDKYIDSQVGMLKDLGPEKLKAAADELLPEIEELKQKDVQQKLQAAQVRRQDAEEASKGYINTITKALSEDKVGKLQLQREEKSKLFAALAKPSFTSLSGKPTNQFVKALEDLQFGQTANMGLFLNIVHHAIDPEGFMEKLKTTITSEVASNTQRELRLAKSNKANTNQEPNRDVAPKKTINKDFVNPFA